MRSCVVGYTQNKTARFREPLLLAVGISLFQRGVNVIEVIVEADLERIDLQLIVEAERRSS